MSARINLEYSLFPLNKDEEATCESMIGVHDSARLLISPTHHIDESSVMNGFRFCINQNASGNMLPIGRNMFHGHTVVECMDKEETILHLMANKDKSLDKLKEFVKRLDSECRPATLDCIPTNESKMVGSARVEATGLPSVDSQSWTPEVPNRLGIYHAYVRNYTREVRAHKLFIACSGGLTKASDAFFNLWFDVGRHWTAQEIFESEEAWWLRKACQRSRCRVIKLLADEFNLKINAVRDVQSYQQTQIAIPTTDTIAWDLSKIDDQVSLYNDCVDTTKVVNGVACAMHPSEGVWIFRGRGRDYGSAFGDYNTCGVFPTSSPCVNRDKSIIVEDLPCIHRTSLAAPRKQRYQCFDEQYMKTLERMQWNRDSGVVELIPIVVSSA